MNIEFRDIGIQIFLKEGFTFFKKDDILNRLNYDPTLQDSCLVVLGNKERNALTIVSDIGEITNKKEYYDIIKVVILNNEKMNISLKNTRKMKCEDGRVIDIFNFTDGKNYMIVIFLNINNHIIMSTCNSTENNLTISVDFAIDVMQSIFKID